MLRRKEIDWLRNGAVLMLFLYHTAVIFDPFSENYVKSPVHSYVAGGFILVTFFWYMPVLFFLAGASAHFSLTGRTNKQFMKERAERLLVPFLFGIAVIVPPQGYFAKLWHNIPTDGYLHHWETFFTTVTDLSGYDGNLTPAHLWFILFLFLISVLLLPLLRYLDGENGRQLLFRLKPVMLSPWGIVIAAVSLFFMRVIPDIGGKNIFYFALIYVFGVVFYSDTDYIDKLCSKKGWALIGILALSPVFLWSEYIMYEGNSMLWLKALEAMVTTVMMIFAVTALVGYGTKHFIKGGRVLSYFNQACFPVYILHQSVLIAVAYYILHLHVPAGIQSVLIILITVSFTFALYELARRISPLRFLLGMKSEKSAQTVKQKVDNTVA